MARDSLRNLAAMEERQATSGSEAMMQATSNAGAAIGGGIERGVDRARQDAQFERQQNYREEALAQSRMAQEADLALRQQDMQARNAATALKIAEDRRRQDIAAKREQRLHSLYDLQKKNEDLKRERMQTELMEYQLNNTIYSKDNPDGTRASPHTMERLRRMMGRWHMSQDGKTAQRVYVDDRGRMQLVRSQETEALAAAQEQARYGDRSPTRQPGQTPISTEALKTQMDIIDAEFKGDPEAKRAAQRRYLASLGYGDPIAMHKSAEAAEAEAKLSPRERQDKMLGSYMEKIDEMLNGLKQIMHGQK